MMDDELIVMTIDEFRTSGLLQEVNRRILHPIGVALSVITDEETGKATAFGPIWDYRNDLDGIRYADSEIDDPDTKDKVAAFDCRWAMAEKARMERLGYVVQPIESKWKEAE